MKPIYTLEEYLEQIEKIKKLIVDSDEPSNLRNYYSLVNLYQQLPNLYEGYNFNQVKIQGATMWIKNHEPVVLYISCILSPF
jgi:hypothetical protein